MVKRLLKIVQNSISKEILGLHQAAYLLAGSSILSQILALFRDRLLASSFGANTNLDLYYSAFRVPDFIFATVGSLVSVSVILPFFINKQKQNNEEAKDFISSIFNFYFLIIVTISVIVFIFTPFILSKLFPVFRGTPNFNDLVLMTRILLLSPFFLGLSNLFSTISQSYRRFFIYSLSPVLYNFGIIFGIFFLHPMFGNVGLAMGVVTGALLHFMIQVPFVISKGFLPIWMSPKKVFNSFLSIKKVILISIPRTITVSANELAELFLISFASFLIPGSISIFNFAFNLQSVPFAIIGISYSMAVFPTLTKHISNGDTRLFIEEMIVSSKHIIFWSVPITALFIVLRAQIVRVILGAGQFNWDDTRLTAACLAIFTISLVAQNMTHLFVRSYYSRGKTMPPLIINIISAIFIVGISYLFVYLFSNVEIVKNFIESIFKVAGIEGTIILALPLGYSFGVVFSMLLHWIDFHFEFRNYSKKVLRIFFQIFGASVIMSWVTHFTLNIFGNILDPYTLVGVFLQGFFAGLIGIFVYIVVLILLKNEELIQIWKTLHSKIWKADIVNSEV